jgi:hypothetical protein
MNDELSKLIELQQGAPPVPESLRNLARKQLQNPAVFKIRSERKMLRDFANHLRRMQAIIIQRCKDWDNKNDWQLLLADFDQAVIALRGAWQEHKDTEPAVKEVVQTWREAHGIAPDLLFMEDSPEFLGVFLPLAETAKRNYRPLAVAAIIKWVAVQRTYLSLLNRSKVAA